MESSHPAAVAEMCAHLQNIHIGADGKVRNKRSGKVFLASGDNANLLCPPWALQRYIFEKEAAD